MQLIDLSHVIVDGMITYPGLPGPRFEEHLSFEASHDTYSEGTEFSIGRISMVTNTGTYLDTPAHRYRDGHDLAGLPLERCVGLDVALVSLGDGPLGPGALVGLDLEGKAVLLHSGWDRHWGTAEYGSTTHPYVDEAGAEALMAAGAGLVGIDSVNIDDTRDGARPAHTLLLAAGIPVVEHLTNLAAVPATGATFTAVPPAIRGLGTFPVRAFATVE